MKISLLSALLALSPLAIAMPTSFAIAPDPLLQDGGREDDEDAAWLEAGRRATQQFLGGEDELLWAAFAPEMQAAMGNHQASLAAFRYQVDAQLGAEAEVVAERVVRHGNDLTYLRKARFEKTDRIIDVAFTFSATGPTAGTPGSITGFSIQPERTEAPSDYLEYETKTELHLPFEGAWTVFWGGRTLKENYHTVTSDQRFAYDILIMKDGTSHEGDGTSLEDYHCFGRPVLSPGAGVAVAAQDGVNDNAPGEMDPAHALGNHVIIDHGNGEFSFLAHLKKGSLAIEKGDRVEVGTLLGVCGNSGNTTEPHIHYHLQDTPDFGEGQGMPAQFQDYVAGGEHIKRGEPVRLQVIQNP